MVKTIGFENREAFAEVVPHETKPGGVRGKIGLQLVVLPGIDAGAVDSDDLPGQSARSTPDRLGERAGTATEIQPFFPLRGCGPINGILKQPDIGRVSLLVPKGLGTFVVRPLIVPGDRGRHEEIPDKNPRRLPVLPDDVLSGTHPGI